MKIALSAVKVGLILGKQTGIVGEADNQEKLVIITRLVHGDCIG